MELFIIMLSPLLILGMCELYFIMTGRNKMVKDFHKLYEDTRESSEKHKEELRTFNSTIYHKVDTPARPWFNGTNNPPCYEPEKGCLGG